jgi:hypothetical protein
MTEAEWLVADDLRAMFEAIEHRASERKLRLFGVACCRRVQHLMTAPEHLASVDVSERLADGLVDEAAMEAALQPILAAVRDFSERGNAWDVYWWMNSAVHHLGTNAASYAASFARRGLRAAGGPADAERAYQCHLLRDVVGSPFRPFRFDECWLDGAGREAVKLARELYESADFSRLSELADVLEQAGYADWAVLDHCRGPGPHVRGCWVVDALMGKECAVREGLLTLADWMRWPDPGPLLEVLRGKGSTRKWRLFAVACCRRFAYLITDERSRRAVEVAARHADGAASDEDLETARAAAEEAEREAFWASHAAEAEANFCDTPEYRAIAERYAAADAALWAARRELGPDRAAEFALSVEAELAAELLRDLFGDHFGPTGGQGRWLPRWLAYANEHWCLLPTPRRVDIRPHWLACNDGAALRLARDAYDAEAFGSLPVLADALEEAGCTDEALLSHLRSPGPHYRGCWALDLILDKE